MGRKPQSSRQNRNDPPDGFGPKFADAWGKLAVESSDGQPATGSDAAARRGVLL
jgi:hypothetical protein